MSGQPETNSMTATDAGERYAGVQSVADGLAAMFTAPSPDKDGQNEDAAAVIPSGPNGGVLVVADGCGGHAGGREASGIAVRRVAECVRAAGADRESYRGAILDAIDQAGREIAGMGVGAGSTIVAADVMAGEVRTYHVGDAFALLVGQRGRVKLQTISHSPVGYAIESGMLDEEEAMHHDDRHVVSNMLGASDMRIEIGPSIRMAARDTLLIGSDGVSDNLGVGEIVEIIRRGSLESAMEALAAACLERMEHPREDVASKPDDLSFILFRRGGDGAAR